MKLDSLYCDKIVIGWDLDNTVISGYVCGDIGLRQDIEGALQKTIDDGHINWLCTSADPAWVQTVFQTCPSLRRYFDKIITCVDMDPQLCGERQFKDISKLGIDVLVDDHGPYKDRARDMYGDAVADRYIIVPKADADVVFDISCISNMVTRLGKLRMGNAEH